MQTLNTNLTETVRPKWLQYKISRSCRPLIVLVMSIVPLCASAAPPIELNRDGIAANEPQREVIYEGMASYGHYRLLGWAEDAKVYTGGVEFDREIPLRLFHARVDYVSEFMPVVLLTQPAVMSCWGDPWTRNRTTVPGIGITPIGFRLLWRDGHRLMPYSDIKATVLGFTQKALSPDATYENWSFHITGGVKVRLSSRYDLRLGLLSDFHFSNAYVVRYNPALDVMNGSVGIVYHLGARRKVH